MPSHWDRSYHRTDTKCLLTFSPLSNAVTMFTLGQVYFFVHFPKKSSLNLTLPDSHPGPQIVRFSNESVPIVSRLANMAGSLTTTNDQTIWPSAICHLLDPHIQKIRFFFKEARKDWIRSTFQPAFNLATRTFCSVKQALAADSWWKGKCSSGPGWDEDSLGDICIVSTSSLSLFCC